ncbi:MAG: hypothetical protein KJ687_11120, partial [Proteobacteria bacterium]|nr:hypothetical protein [Pseudomonadota bacterium]
FSPILAQRFCRPRNTCITVLITPHKLLREQVPFTPRENQCGVVHQYWWIAADPKPRRAGFSTKSDSR